VRTRHNPINAVFFVHLQRILRTAELATVLAIYAVFWQVQLVNHLFYDPVPAWGCSICTLADWARFFNEITVTLDADDVPAIFALKDGYLSDFKADRAFKLLS
jgi:hypothetical protein